eukprot:NODE_1919_length_697_cov_73.650877_g1869_i0.p1 GENE.NODE_1919_length_697_cov_73.650877_g1869_i0~~NODE_1919_length_697_cov_73.650877_g1869_i0.p1  ORF type:complete len:200 (-),score=22.08 NODE_1919_length_697_cov_73.650877_g1869_i0:12-611(-)
MGDVKINKPLIAKLSLAFVCLIALLVLIPGRNAHETTTDSQIKSLKEEKSKPENPDRAVFSMFDNETIAFDPRGWIASPRFALPEVDIDCVDIHVGIIKPGFVRGNHRHHAKSELLMTWGADTIWRFEDESTTLGYMEHHLGADQQFTVFLPEGIAHAIKNVDQEGRALNLLGCASGNFDPENPQTDYQIWSDMTAVKS